MDARTVSLEDLLELLDVPGEILVNGRTGRLWGFFVGFHLFVVEHLSDVR